MVFFLRMLVRLFARLFPPQRRREPSDPIECLLVGYGGANNTGAEARTAEAIRQMLHADTRVHITLTSLDRRQTLRYVSEDDRLRVAQIHPVFLVSILRLVRCADVVVLIEGSCFKENFSAALLWFFLYAADLAQRMGIATVAYGVDAGKLTGRNRDWAVEVADRIDLLMTRTQAAQIALRTMGVARPVIVTTDTAFTLEPARRDWVDMVLAGQGIDPHRPLMGIAFEEFFWWPVAPHPLKALFGVRRDRYKSIYYHGWGDDGRERSKAMQEAMAAYADWVCEDLGVQVVFFAMERLDAQPCRQVMERMRSPSALFDADHASAAQMTGLLRRLDWLVTCRYHALVLSMGGFVPTIGLAHDERIAAIMDELGFLEAYFIAYREDRIGQKLREKTARLRTDSASIRRHIESTLPTYRKRMAQNERHFHDLIEKRFS